MYPELKTREKMSISNKVILILKSFNKTTHFFCSWGCNFRSLLHYIDVKDSLTRRLAISSIYPLFVDRFERYLLLMVVGAKTPGIGKGFWILIDFGELNVCGPCGPFFHEIYRSNYKFKAILKIDLSAYPIIICL